ncbi:MAG TPA: HAMP domain-containing sensor histidine kinase [Candidatus Dormibacteraeota bacterium]|nr:HAMP domain-containing sensor histidine kinase [Candidatus Dormibacteraeota bacterium]
MTTDAPTPAPAVRRDSAFRAFFRRLAVGAVQISPGGDFIEVNEAYCRLTGYDRVDLLRMRVADVDHPDDREADRVRWDAFLGDPSVGYDVEKRYLRRDGEVIWVHATAAVIDDGTERPLIAKTVEDITERVRATQGLREREERLHEALAAKEEFLGLVSHELRTPLTVIVGLADVISRDQLPAEALRDIGREIRESSEHLAGLLESMLMLARADQPDQRDLEPLLLTRAVERVVERHRQVHPGRGYSLDGRFPDGLVEGHEPWIAQVVGNLLSNAEKYGPIGGEIEVTVERAGHEAVVRVLDEGPGIAPADIPLLFEPFYRAEHAREQSGGLGLGLAVCRRLIELQGGRIWAATRPEGGSEFGFALPAIDAAD